MQRGNAMADTSLRTLTDKATSDAVVMFQAMTEEAGKISRQGGATSLTYVGSLLGMAVLALRFLPFFQDIRLTPVEFIICLIIAALMVSGGAGIRLFIFVKTMQSSELAVQAMYSAHERSERASQEALKTSAESLDKARNAAN